MPRVNEFACSFVSIKTKLSTSKHLADKDLQLSPIQFDSIPFACVVISQWVLQASLRTSKWNNNEFKKGKSKHVGSATHKVKQTTQLCVCVYVDVDRECQMTSWIQMTQQQQQQQQLEPKSGTEIDKQVCWR